MKVPKALNYYELLDVPQDAGKLEIIHAYRRAKLTYQTDSLATYSLFGEDELPHIRDEIEQAYRTLSDPERRRAYDDELAAGAQNGQADRQGEENA